MKVPRKLTNAVIVIAALAASVNRAPAMPLDRPVDTAAASTVEGATGATGSARSRVRAAAFHHVSEVPFYAGGNVDPAFIGRSAERTPASPRANVPAVAPSVSGTQPTGGAAPAAAAATATSSPSELLQRQALAYARNTLKLRGRLAPRAEEFARGVVEHSQTRNNLDRYRWAYSQFNMGNEQAIEQARTMAEQVSALSPQEFATYSQAFHFAFANDEMDLSLDESLEFARSASAAPAANFLRYRSAFRNAMGDGVIGRNGRDNLLAKKYARMVADSAADKTEPRALDRYRWVFRNVPAKTESDFAKALGLAEQLSTMTPKEYSSFQYRVVSKVPSRSRNVMARLRAIDSARSAMGLPVVASKQVIRGAKTSVPTGQMRSGSMSVVPSGEVGAGTRPDDDRGLIQLEHPNVAVPGVGCNNVTNGSISEFVASNIPGFNESLEVIQNWNMKLPVNYPASVPASIRSSIKAASVAFAVPEKVLYCSFGTESKFKSRALSPKGATGLAQIMESAFRDISNIQVPKGSRAANLTPAELDLRQRWEVYRRFQRSLQNPVPGHGSYKTVARDPFWSIGAGALWTKNYERMFLERHNMTEKDMQIQDYVMVVGGYNMGMHGFRKVCSPGHLAECSVSSEVPRETKKHMRKIETCLGNIRRDYAPEPMLAPPAKGPAPAGTAASPTGGAAPAAPEPDLFTKLYSYFTE